MKRGARIGFALLTLACVFAVEIGGLFMLNGGMTVLGIVTVVALVLLGAVATRALGARGGVLVGISALGVVPGACWLASWELRRQLSIWCGSSDAEDFGVFALLAGGSAAGATLAVWLAGHVITKRGHDVVRALLAVVFAAVVISLAASRPARADIAACAFGVALAGVHVALALRARRRHDRLASGRGALHKGEGWIELDDDGAPPLHRPELSRSEPGPVVVLADDGARAPSTGYRDGRATLRVTAVTPGSAAEIRARGLEYAASSFAIATTILLFCALRLLAVPLLQLPDHYRESWIRQFHKC